jgi:hypothetical protein
MSDRLDGDLELAPLGPDRCRVILAASYAPPLASLGRALEPVEKVLTAGATRTFAVGGGRWSMDVAGRGRRRGPRPALVSTFGHVMWGGGAVLGRVPSGGEADTCHGAVNRGWGSDGQRTVMTVESSSACQLWPMPWLHMA